MPGYAFRADMLFYRTVTASLSMCCFAYSPVTDNDRPLQRLSMNTILSKAHSMSWACHHYACLNDTSAGQKDGRVTINSLYMI
jgi:hypothetical protein